MIEYANESSDSKIQRVADQLSKARSSPRRRAFEKFFLAALGSIPWVGGFLSAAAELKLDADGNLEDTLQSQWLREHQIKIGHLQSTLDKVAERFANLGNSIDERIESEEYLALVRRAFRTWDRSDAQEKRDYVANLVTNAAGTTLTPDDVVSLFIDWLDLYHETHFAVIGEIYRNPGCTRFEMWDSIHGPLPREDSAEADLFRMLIRDLSIGGVIRQERDTTAAGEFLRKPRRRRSGPGPATMESAFEDSKPYVLTELGKQFVHYTMTGLVPRLGQQEEGKE